MLRGFIAILCYKEWSNAVQHRSCEPSDCTALFTKDLNGAHLIVLMLSALVLYVCSANTSQTTGGDEPKCLWRATARGMSGCVTAS